MNRTLPGLVALTALVAIVCGFQSPQSFAQVKKGSDLDQSTTVAALTKLGGEAFTFEVTETGVIHLKAEKGEKVDPAKKLPVLHFAGADDKLLARLPKSEAAVGLDLHGTKVGDAGMKSVANLKNLQLLSVGNTSV